MKKRRGFQLVLALVCTLLMLLLAMMQFRWLRNMLRSDVGYRLAEQRDPFYRDGIDLLFHAQSPGQGTALVNDIEVSYTWKMNASPLFELDTLRVKPQRPGLQIRRGFRATVNGEVVQVHGGQPQ